MFEQSPPPGASTPPFARSDDLQRADRLYPLAEYRLLAITLAVVVTAFFLWAAFARIEQVTSGEGRVISSSREQVIQSLEGGIVAALTVREGEVVEKGQVLVRMDPVRAEAAYQEMRQHHLALTAQAVRLRAEAGGSRLLFPETLRNDAPEAVKTEQALYAARRRALEESIAALARLASINQREEGIIGELVSKGLVGEVEHLKVKRLVNEANMQIAERRNKFQAEANAELSKVESERAQVSETLTARRDQLARTDIRAPLRGTVKNIRVYTIGGVVQPGADIMEIVPADESLLVEVRIKPADIAFLSPDMEAYVKLSAYDHLIYGGLHGRVEHISPDTVRDDQKRATGLPEQDNYYRVLVRTREASLTRDGKPLPIIPGMLAMVDIRTGEKSVLNYLLRPVVKMQEAFRER